MALKFAVNNSLSAVTSLPTAIPTGSMTLLQTQTASSSATIDFTSNIDSTYDSYVFKFINMHPATDAVNFQFQADTGTNTNYNQTITSTSFSAQHNEADSVAQQAYHAGFDQAQGTGFQQINANEVGADADQCISGTLHLFNPSNTTFVKHFILRSVVAVSSNQQEDVYVAGYFNTTTALTRVRFKFNSGNIDSGVIKMYGIK
jgi:hypothetical protein